MTTKRLKTEITAQNKTQRAFAQVKRDVGSLKKGFGALKGSLAAIGATVAVSSLTRMATQAREAADEIGKTAKAVGVTAESLQRPRYAADLSGVSNAALDTSLQRFVRTIGELRNDTGSLTTFLKKFDTGLLSSLKTTTDTEGALKLFLERMDATTAATDKAALAAAAFGRAGVRMTNIVATGAGSIKAAGDELTRLGGVMSNEVIAEAERMNDAFTRTSATIGTQLKLALLDLQPVMLWMMEAFKDIVVLTADIVNSFKEVEDLSLRALRRRIDAMTAEYERLRETRSGKRGGPSEWVASVLGGDLEEKAREIKRLERLYGTRKSALEVEENYQRAKMEGARRAQERAAKLVPSPDVPALAPPSLAAMAEEEAKSAKATLKALKDRVAAEGRVTAAFRRSVTEGERARRMLDARNEALGLGVKMTDEQIAAYQRQSLALRGLESEQAKIIQQQEELNAQVERFGEEASRAFADAVVGVRSWRDALRGLASEALQQFNRMAMAAWTANSAQAGAGGSFLGGLASGVSGFLGGLFGFQHGGSFRVGGHGGTDSQLVAFRASPGEQVIVNPPGGGNSQPIVRVNYYIDARGADAGVEQRIARALAAREPVLLKQARELAFQDVLASAHSGGAMARATGR